MPEDALLKAIEEDASVQAARIIDEAEDAARQTSFAVEREVSDFKDARLRSLAVELEKKKASEVNSARTFARGLSLKVREGLIEKVFEETLKRLEGLPGEKREALVARLYEELKNDWARRSVERPLILVNPSDAGAIKDGWGAVMGDSSVSLGVIFVSTDKKIVFDNTIESRLKRAQRALLPRIDAMLFE